MRRHGALTCEGVEREAPGGAGGSGGHKRGGSKEARPGVLGPCGLYGLQGDAGEGGAGHREHPHMAGRQGRDNRGSSRVRRQGDPRGEAHGRLLGRGGRYDRGLREERRQARHRPSEALLPGKRGDEEARGRGGHRPATVRVPQGQTGRRPAEHRLPRHRRMEVHPLRPRDALGHRSGLPYDRQVGEEDQVRGPMYGPGLLRGGDEGETSPSPRSGCPRSWGPRASWM